MVDASMRFGLEEFTNPKVPKVDKFISDDEVLRLAGLEFSCLLVPGHSPGSLCFYFSKENNNIEQDFVICGDTVFAGSIGRVDLTGGTNMEDLVGNINKKLMILPDDTVLFLVTGQRLKSELKKSNPFLLGYT